MRRLLADLERELTDLAAADLRRTLAEPAGIDFASNDYLGLAADPRLAAAVASRLDAGGGVGAPASRLLRGHTRLHAELEARLAAWKGTEAALLFPSGYQANVATITALVRPGDRVLSDAANHASLIDGIRLSRAAKVVVPHLDAGALARALDVPWPGRTFVVTESLFSMDGDVAPLDRVAELCERHDAALVVDDAHATGLFGERGSGLVERFGVAGRVAAVVSTGGKALGVGGGFVAAPATVIDALVNRARPFLFTTAVPPLLLHALGAALDLVAREPARRARVHVLAARLRASLVAAGIEGVGSEGPIVPVLVGDNRRALEAAAAIQGEGFDVRAVRPPTVAPGTARLRISVHADHREADLDRLARAVAAAVGAAVPVAAGV